MGHDYIGHNYIGHNYIVTVPFISSIADADDEPKAASFWKLALMEYELEAIPSTVAITILGP